MSSSLYARYIESLSERGQLIVRKLRAALLSVTFTVMDTVVYSSKELRYSHSNFDIGTVLDKVEGFPIQNRPRSSLMLHTQPPLERVLLCAKVEYLSIN